MNSLEHEKYIRQTLEIAAQAVRDGDHPFGALMVLDGEVVSSSGNRARIDSDYTAHAEILVVADATGKLTPSELSRAVFYSSTEPCMMCTGAILVTDRASDLAEDEAAVRAVESAYDVAWNAGDIAAVLNLLTDRIVMTNPSGETTVGRDEAASTLAALMDGPARGSKHNSEVVAVRFVNSDVALVDGLATISGFGEHSEPLRHNYTDVLVRTSDGWRIDQVRAYVFMQLPD